MAFVLLFASLASAHLCRGDSTGLDQTIAEFIFLNATVYTVDPANPKAQAFAVSQGRFLAVGTDEELLALFPSAPVVDLAGLTVTPGFIDAHTHLQGMGMSESQANLVGTTSPEECVERLLPYAPAVPAGQWLLARGWDQERFTDPVFPTKEDLDEDFPDLPVYLSRVDGHAAWINSAALRLASPLPDQDPPGGSIIRDENGEPTGVFIDTAMDLITVHIPVPSREENQTSLENGIKSCLRHGITSIHDAGVPEEELSLWIDNIEIDNFNLRVYAMVKSGLSSNTLWCERGFKTYGDGLLSIRSVKIMIDGALGSRGAALIEEYSDDPGNFGLLMYTPENFLEEVALWLQCGFQVNTHAIGDRGNQFVLDGYEAALKLVEYKADRRLRIEHSQIVHPADFERFHRLNVTASMQPTHATSDMLYAEDRLGPERILGGYAWRTMLNSSVHLIFGSDFPVEPVNPLIGFYAAVTRKDPKTFMPEGGWYPEQRLTREETLKAFTVDAAWAAFQENDIGSISVGKRADFVVLDTDIMTVEPPEEILSASVLYTYLGGEKVYDAFEGF